MRTTIKRLVVIINFTSGAVDTRERGTPGEEALAERGCDSGRSLV